MARPFILLGDKTDHGGVVITASGNTSTNGKGIACVGDRVTCPRSGHGGITVIVTGDPNVIIDGRAAARHGDKTACGATLLSSQGVTGSE
ncbi:PAAR domain-containing protein [Cupriavidus alkaliphilus]|uniref:PAAR domain-containing protein n=1 Tax=Cupriavidus alkaliphilus TaxID=942866 RepID=UPI000815BD57|nr:PAAR domain-containing protein [Cupriavidus alkaliphilus]SCB22468.1 Zn-binding Pro-Ala-Ala-Arg (PAAR) domain-containing protein, incolved in TypeVI secretion [Cupriavidus alkaliphilus]